MKKLLILSAICLFMTGTHSAYASVEFDRGIHDDVPGNAVIKGRIVNENNEVLPWATIQVLKSEIGTVSDVNGYYTLTGIKPGKHTLRVTYVGYQDKDIEVTISNGKAQVVNIVMNEGQLLDQVNVVGALSGQRKALNAQKNNMGVSNVVSADQVGKFPDYNIGDALKRINGINMQYDQGEARFGQVRGTSPELSSVTVNGNRMASSDGDVRQVQLDLIPADMIQTIEVNKVITSDMDGDAIGGAVNLITKNSPYKRVFNATLGSGYNWVSEKPQLNAGITYGDRFFNKKLGVMGSVSYQRSPAGSDNTQFEYVVDDNGNVVMDNAQVRHYMVTRERQSYSLSMDYDLNPNNRFYFKSIYNRHNDWEARYRLTYKDIAKGPGSMSARLQTKSSDHGNARFELQQTMDFSFGGEHQMGKLKTDWDASYSRATEDRPNERFFDLHLKKQTFDMHDIFGRQPYSTTPVDPTDGGKWSIKEVTNSNRNVAENVYKLKVNFELPMASGLYGNKLKFGAKHSHLDKKRKTEAYDYTDWYEDTYGNDYINHYDLAGRDGFMAGSQYPKTNFVDREYLGGIKFDPTNGTFIKEEASTDYNATENISAAYFRLDQQLGHHMALIAGLRLEATHMKYSGLVWNVDEDTEEETLTPSEVVRNNYINLLPSILWKWDVTSQWKIRASFTETLSRPRYTYLIPSVAIDTKSGARTSITIGNPDLKPATSLNFDLATEYYFKDLGIISAGVFMKRINNFVVNEVTYGDYKTYSNCQITKPVNGFDGNLFGVELGLQRDFGFIHPSLKCFGFDGNYTYTDTKVISCYVGDKENQIMPGSPKNMLNASLFFDKWGFKTRLSYNYTSSFQDDEQFVSDRRLRRYYDETNYLDLNLSYTYGKKFKTTFYAEATNLMNQPLRYYIGQNQDTTTQVEYYGRKINFGIKMNF